jgi:hypothetical protein
MKKLILSLALCGAVLSARAQGSQTQPIVSTYFPTTYALTNGVLEGTTVVLGGSTNAFTNVVTSILYTNNTGSGSPGFVTNSITNAFTNVVYPWINVQQQSKVGVGCSFNCSAADTSAKTVQFAYSLDGIYSNISTAQLLPWVLTGTGTTKVIDITNIANLGVGYLIPYSFQDGSSTSLEYTTNITFTYSTKKSAP